MLLSLLTFYKAGESETLLLYRIIIPIRENVHQTRRRIKENLLSLYNALNKTSYEDVDSLEITTLENAIYMNYKNDILSDFLLKNRAEAVEMCIFEYDEEKHMKHEREIWKKEGEERLLKLLEILKAADRMEDIERAITDKEYREQLYRENNLGM